MGPLELVRALAGQVKRVNPATLSRPQQAEFRELSRKFYVPQHGEAQRLEEKLLERMAKARTEEERDTLAQAAKAAEYKAARLAKMDQAASSIARAKGIYDEDLRAFVLPGENAPSGIATFYPPGHYAGDPLADSAAYLELLGATGEVPGTGRVLLRSVGMDSPADPLMWHSTSYPETLGFYEARGATRIPKESLPKDSLLYGNLPVFKVDKGRMVKEAEGGVVRMRDGGSSEARSAKPLDLWAGVNLRPDKSVMDGPVSDMVPDTESVMFDPAMVIGPAAAFIARRSPLGALAAVLETTLASNDASAVGIPRNSVKWLEALYSKLPPMQARELSAAAKDNGMPIGKYLQQSHPTMVEDLRKGVSSYKGSRQNFKCGGLTQFKGAK